MCAWSLSRVVNSAMVGDVCHRQYMNEWAWLCSNTIVLRGTNLNFLSFLWFYKILLFFWFLPTIWNFFFKLKISTERGSGPDFLTSSNVYVVLSIQFSIASFIRWLNNFFYSKVDTVKSSNKGRKSPLATNRLTDIHEKQWWWLWWWQEKYIIVIGNDTGVSVNYQLLLLHRNNQVVSPKRKNKNIMNENVLYLLHTFLFSGFPKRKTKFLLLCAERGIGGTASSVVTNTLFLNT